VSWLGGQFDLSKRDLKELVERGFEIPISLGSVCALDRRAQHALAPAHAEALEALVEADVLWVDETGWFEQNERHWLWTAVGDEDTPITAFRIDPSRSREALEALVDEDFEGIVSSDRYGAYNGRDPEHRQICWQHLVRDFRGLVARDGPGAEPAGQLLTIAWLIFWKLSQIRRGDTTRAQLRERVDETWRPATRKILQRATQADDAPGIFANLLEREPALWTFAWVDGVEPTNNRAERAVRPAVIKRKLSFGTQSADGSRLVERMLTVCQSLRRQGRSVLDFLEDSLLAWRTAQTPPTLVPG
jgi:transposase